MGAKKRPHGQVSAAETPGAAADSAAHGAAVHESAAPRDKAGPQAEQRPPFRPNAMTAESMLYLHRSTMVDWKLAPVVDIAAWQLDGSVVAVGYEDGAIELWDTDSWACFLQIPPQDGPELSCLAWVPDPVTSHPRLFGAFLDGTISEVDLVNLRYHSESHSYGGAVWCLAPSPPPLSFLSTPATSDGPPPEKKQRKSTLVESAGIGYLAAACDDGSVRLLTVEGGVPGVAYSRTLARVEGRLLTVSWHPEGHTIVSGGIDGCIRCWDVVRGIERCRITASVKTRQQLCVWSVAVLHDGTIVAGDSEGGTAFYDPQFGTQIARFTQHQGDVLTVCGTPDGRRVFSAGVDAKVAMFERVRDEERGTDDWVYRHYKSPHTHDVRSLEVVTIPELGPMLLSGGNDTQLLLYPADKFLQQHPVRVCRSPRRPHIHLAPDCKMSVSSSPSSALEDGIPGGAATLALNGAAHNQNSQEPAQEDNVDGVAGAKGGSAVCWLLAAQGKKMNVWQLGRPRAVQIGREGGYGGRRQRPPREGDFMDVQDPPMHVAEFVTSGKSGILCAAISRCGRYVACSDDSRLRVYCLSQPTEPSPKAWAPTTPKVQIQKMKLSKNIGPAVSLAFLPDSAALLMVSPAGTLSVLDLSNGQEIASEDVSKFQKASRSASIKAGGKRKSAAAFLHHPVSHISTSKSGIIATAGSTGVHLFHLQHPTPSSSPDAAPSSQPDSDAPSPTPQLQASDTEASWKLQHKTQVMQLGTHAPVVGLEFSPCGQLLLVVRADAAVQLYNANTGMPSEWSVDNGALQMDRLPGALMGASFRPSAVAHELLLHTSSGFCYLDLRKIAQPADAKDKKPGRKRGMKTPSLQVAGSSNRGSNWRLFNLEHPCLYLGYIQANAAVLLECPWEDALAQLPAPLHKHQYGA